MPELATTDPPPRQRRERRHPRPEDTIVTTVPKLALSVEEACQALTISRPTLYNLIAAGQIRTVMAGRRRLIPITELERLLADKT